MPQDVTTIEELRVLLTEHPMHPTFLDLHQGAPISPELADMEKLDEPGPGDDHEVVAVGRVDVREEEVAEVASMYAVTPPVVIMVDAQGGYVCQAFDPDADKLQEMLQEALEV